MHSTEPIGRAPHRPAMPDDGPEVVSVKELLTRAGGAYIPPYRLKQLQAQVEDKSSEDYQRLTWEALKKSINGLVNKVAVGNIQQMVPEVFGENLVRGRGLFCRSLMKAQMSSPAYTHVYAGLVAIINTKMPELGELLLKRVILQFRRAYRRNDKPVCIAVTKFIAHLVNQQVAHEILALQVGPQIFPTALPPSPGPRPCTLSAHSPQTPIAAADQPTHPSPALPGWSRCHPLTALPCRCSC